MNWKRILSLAAVLAIAWAVFGRSGAPSSVTPMAPPPVLVRVAEAKKTDVPFVIRAPGLVLASETVAVHARVDSQVVEVHFREGETVHAGQLLFSLDDRALRADLKRQQATLATAQAELANARRQFERARKLAAGGFESTSELDQARANFETSDARTSATEAEIERLQVMIGYTAITAAIDGRAGAIAATAGNTVKANDAAQPLVVINRVSPILVQIGLPQQVLAPLRSEMAHGAVAVRVLRDGVELPQAGEMAFVDNAIDRTTATFESRARFRNADEALWPGMIVEVLLRLGEDTDVVVIPAVAVQQSTSGAFVFVVEATGARRRMVTVRRYGDGVAVVTDGLVGGEKVAIDGMLSLSEGSPVQIVAEKTPDSESVSK